MLAIRMQRTGRKGHAQYRLIVQDSRFSPTSGRVVAYVGSYNPHTKAVNLDKSKIESYLSNGTQPSLAAVRLLKKEGVKLPAWVNEPSDKKRSIRNPEKLRRNRPAGETEAAAESPAAEESAETPESSTPAAEGDQPADETPAEPATEEPASKEAAAEEPSSGDQAA
ncbi:MAG TPA: 30S ribosomal protein S16 [Candidatus Saccharimonadales bacterium]|nr:30S ribosomal protein S16 [Candidatus Saccharimonadales bacterium]